MPTITLDRKEVLAALGKKLSDEQLAKTITMLGTACESIEGNAITIEVFPNRPDLLSPQGLVRALRAFLGVEPGLKKYAATPSGEHVIVEKSVAGCRPHTSCAIVRGLKITDALLKDIIMIQEKLHVTFGRNRKRLAIGIYPLERIAFPIRFAGLKPSELTFRPLESSKEMSAQRILEEHPKGKEYAHLVAGLERYACFLDAKGEVMSFTPIINSHRTGKITEETTAVFVECSGFDQRVLDECLAMLVTALADMGGKVESVELRSADRTITTPALAPRRMRVDEAYINRLLGLSLTSKEFARLFAKMGYGVEKQHVLVPPYRTDILHQADLAEDIGIAYGFESIPETIPNVATVAGEDPLHALTRALRGILVGRGLLEAHSFNLTSAQRQQLLGATPILLASSVSEGYDSLRASVLPSLLETLERNKVHEYPQEFFEVGKTFAKSASAETGVEERTRLAIALCRDDADYTRIRQACDALCAALGVAATYQATEHPAFIPGRTARILAGKREIGVAGELHPRALAAYQLEMPVAVLELDLDAILDLLAQ